MVYKFPDKPIPGIQYYIRYRNGIGTKMGFGSYLGDHVWEISCITSGKKHRITDEDIIEWRTFNTV